MIHQWTFRSASASLAFTTLALCLWVEGADPCRAAQPSEELAPLAAVNGEAVTGDMLARNLGRTHQAASEGARPDLSVEYERLMFKTVNDVLLAQEARALEMEQDDSIRQAIDEYKLDAAIKILDREEVYNYSEPTEDEVIDLFKRQYARATFRIITVDEKEKAAQLLSELENGADIEALVEEHSVDPYRARGGLVSRISRFDLDRRVSEIVFGLQVGEAAGPVQTDLGWSVVKVESFEEADLERLEDLEPTLRGLVRQRKASEAREVFVKDLNRKYPVEIHEIVVESIQPERGPDGRQQPSVPDSEAIVAKVGSQPPIHAEEYSKALADRWKRVRNFDAAVASAPLVLDGLIQEGLVLEEVKARNYTELPEVVQGARAYETELLAMAYLQEVLAPTIEVTEEEKQAYYEVHKDSYHRPPQVRLSQVTVESREEADRIAAELSSGADIAWVAKENSIDRLAEQGGDRGWYAPQPGAPGMDQVLMTAAVGAVLPPNGVPGNWVVIRVMGRKEQGIYPLQEISGNIREAVYGEKFRSELDTLIKTLRSRSAIEINEEALSALSIQGTKADEGEKSGHGH